MIQTRPFPATGEMRRIAASLWRKYPHRCWLNEKVLKLKLAEECAGGHNGEHWASYNTISGRIYAFSTQEARDKFAAKTGAEIPCPNATAAS